MGIDGSTIVSVDTFAFLKRTDRPSLSEWNAALQSAVIALTTRRQRQFEHLLTSPVSQTQR